MGDEVTLEDLARKVNKIEKAFIDSDFDGHRRYHEAMIERNAEIRKLRHAIVEKSLIALVWAGAAAIGMGLWEVAKLKLGIHN